MIPSTWSRVALSAIVVGVALAGCTAPPSPNASPSVEESVEYSPEVLRLADLVTAMHLKVLGSLTELGALIDEDATECRLEAEQRAADQLVLLADTHLVALGDLLDGERAEGAPDRGAVARAAAELAALRAAVAANEGDFIQCETDAAAVRSRVGGVRVTEVSPGQAAEVISDYGHLRSEALNALNNLIVVRPQTQCVLDLTTTVNHFLAEIVTLRPQIQTLQSEENDAGGPDQSLYDTVESQLASLTSQMAQIDDTGANVCQITGF